MLSVKFNSLVEFFDYLPENERIMTHVLRDLVRETLPEAKEKLSFSVPFYSINKTVCFLWPGSVLWGKKRLYEGVRMGFNYGQLIDPNEEFLRLDQRKSVAYLDLTTLDNLPVEQIQHYLLLSRKSDAESKKRKR